MTNPLPAFDLVRLMNQVNRELDDSDESASEVLVRIHQLLVEQNIPVSLANCFAKGSTSASGENKPFSFEDYCLVMDGNYYNFMGQVDKDNIADVVGQQVLDDYAHARCDPGETQMIWDLDAVYNDNLYLHPDTNKLLSELVGREVAHAQQAQLQGEVLPVKAKRKSSRL